MLGGGGSGLLQGLEEGAESCDWPEGTKKHEVRDFSFRYILGSLAIRDLLSNMHQLH